MSDAPPRLLVLVGPTAVGKTALAVALAQAAGGEIVSADSRQIYRDMDIGTAKATPQERAAAPHHLLDVVAPDGELTLAHYLRLADAAVRAIWARGALPMLVGGTGQYVTALLEGWTVPEAAPDLALRAQLQAEAEQLGAEALHARLAQVDPVAAVRIDARNVRRVIRALEVFTVAGQPISTLQRKHPPDYCVLKLGLTRPRDELYRRIDARVEAMLAQGLVDEVRWLAAQGYGWELPAMSGLGYQQIGQYLRGELTLGEAVALIKRHTRRFVRQQYNWFSLGDASIHWLEAASLDPIALQARVMAFARGAESTS